jgi:hypothetical protein
VTSAHKIFDELLSENFIVKVCLCGANLIYVDCTRGVKSFHNRNKGWRHEIDYAHCDFLCEFEGLELELELSTNSCRGTTTK